jgi:periplasmic protein TonB
MDFAKRQRDPRRHVVGFLAVIVFHAIVVYALVTGLAKKVVDVVRAPIETKVIEEIKKTPPPPEVVVPPPPRLEAPPPPFIPPPEIQIAVVPPPAPVITVTPTPPPPAPVVIAPAPPPVPTAPVAVAPPPPVAPPAPPKPVAQSVGTVCTKVVKPELPSIDVPVNATINVSYTIQGGKITKMDVVKQTYTTNVDRKVKRALIAAIEAAVAEYVCSGDFTDVPQEFSFKIN